MALTYPQFAAPLTISGTNHLRINYSAGDPELASIAAGDYYFDGSASSDLHDAIDAALEAADTAGAGSANFAVTSNASGHLVITITPGSRAIASIECMDTTSLTSIDLGFDEVAGAEALAPVGDVVTAPYRHAWLWRPGDVLLVSDPHDQRLIVVSTAPSGAGTVDDYGGYIERAIVIGPAIEAALVSSEYTGQASFVANVTGLTIDDPNAPLDSFLGKVRTKANGPIPTLRFCPDYTAPATFKAIRLLRPELYAGIRGWVGDPTSMSPLLYGIAIEVAEV